jgi:hypothetical protein
MNKNVSEKRRKVIPQNIQNAIDKYFKENEYTEPKTIKLDSLADFDVVEHAGDYIEFKPGGKVGDGMWKLQYMHNSCILLESQRKKNKEVFFAPETLIRIDNNNQLSTIDILIDDVLIEKIDFVWMEIANIMYELRPHIESTDGLYFIHLDNYLQVDENHPSDQMERIKIVLNYPDNKQILRMDDVVVAKY